MPITDPIILWPSMADDDGNLRATRIVHFPIPEGDLPAFLDHNVRYALVDVWLAEHDRWMERLLIPIYGMEAEAVLWIMDRDSLLDARPPAGLSFADQPH